MRANIQVGGTNHLIYTRALGELASAGITGAREELRALARQDNTEAVRELIGVADIEGLAQAGSESATVALKELASVGSERAVKVFIDRRDVSALESLAAQIPAAHAALVDLATARNEDALAALARMKDVPGLVAASKAEVNAARTHLMILANEGNPEAQAAIWNFLTERS